MQAFPLRAHSTPSGSTASCAVPLDQLSRCIDAAASGFGSVDEASSGENLPIRSAGSATGESYKQASVYARAWELLHPEDAVPGADPAFTEIARRYRRQAIREHLRFYPRSPFEAELREQLALHR